MLKVVPDAAAAAKSPASHALREAFSGEVDARAGDADFARREQVALELANEVVRADLTGALEKIVERHGEEDVRVHGVCYRFHEWGAPKYQSLVGPLTPRRPTFRQLGVRNGPTVVSLELEAGLIERATPALASRSSMGKGDGPSRDRCRQLIASYRVPPSRSTLETLGHAIGTKLDQRRFVIEAVARPAEVFPEGTRTLVLGLARTPAPMEEDLPPGTPRRPRKQPRVRKAPPPVTVNYRMAYVGTVALADAEGDVLHTFKYAATRDDGPEAILHAMMRGRTCVARFAKTRP